MNIYRTNKSRIASLIFLIYLITPSISFSNNQSTEAAAITASIQTTPKTGETTTSGNKQTPKKDLLSVNSEITPFIISGLIVGFIMLASFATLAIMQWRKNKPQE